jgi:hypothetical protein
MNYGEMQEVAEGLVRFLDKTPEELPRGALFCWSHKVSCLLAADEAKITEPRPETYGELSQRIQDETPLGRLFVRATAMTLAAKQAHKEYQEKLKAAYSLGRQP